MIAAYLIEPGRSAYLLDDLAAEYGLELEPEPPAERRPRSSCGTPRRRGASPRRCASGSSSAGRLDLYERIELPLTAVLAAMEDAGVKIDTYRMGEITARLRDRVEELEARATDLAGEEFMLGSTQQVAQDPVREARPRAGPEREDRVLDRQSVLRGLRDARDRAGDRGVARVLEAAEHVSRCRCRR